MKKFTIELSEDVIKQINIITTYENSKNTLLSNDRDNHVTVEDFISGCVHYYLEQVDSYSHLVVSDGKLQNNLKQIMNSIGMKQKQLADLTKIDPGNLNAVLSNRYQPTLDNFLKIWVALGRPNMLECFYRKN